MPRAPGSPGIKAPGRGPDGPGGVRPRVPASSGQGLGAWQAYDLSQLVQLCTTVRYVRKTGSDSNGGTSPSDAWLTVNHALQTASPGTIIYVGAGVYRETVSVTITATPAAPVALVGDVDGGQTGDGGMVQVTAYTTNDVTTPAGSNTIDCGGKSNLYFFNLFVVGGNAAVPLGATESRNCAFVRCAFFSYLNGNNNAVGWTNNNSGPTNLVFDRCIFLSSNDIINLLLPGSAGGGAYNANVVFKNCTFWGLGTTKSAVNVTSNGGSTLAGNVRILNCFIFNARAINIAVGIGPPCRVSGCVGLLPGNSLLSGSGTTILEDHNVFYSNGARPGSIPVGPGSFADGRISPLFHVGQELFWGAMLRPPGEAMSSSPLRALGGGDSSAAGFDQGGGPRQAGIGVWDAGPYQRGNNLGQETSVVHSGSNAISITGPGFQDFQLPVASGLVTLSIYCQYDSSYAGPQPQFQVLANEALGVGAASVDLPPAQSGTWQQAVLAINPTGNGIVTVRVVSNDTSGISKVAFDSFQAA